MKQKVVIRVTMTGQKSRRKALKIVVSHSGVESAGLKGQDKSQIEVTGDGVDAAELTILLRKNVGFAELVSVTPVGEKKDANKDEAKVQPPPTSWPYAPAAGFPHYIHEYYHPHQCQDPQSCSIM